MAGKSKPGAIHLRIIEVMKRFPDGISGGQIREELEKEGLEAGDQTHLDRRKRDLPKWFAITKEIATSVVNGKKRRVTLYKFIRKRGEIVDEGQINRKIWAEVIHSARGRCQARRLWETQPFVNSSKPSLGERRFPSPRMPDSLNRALQAALVACLPGFELSDRGREMSGGKNVLSLDFQLGEPIARLGPAKRFASTCTLDRRQRNWRHHEIGTPPIPTARSAEPSASRPCASPRCSAYMQPGHSQGHGARRDSGSCHRGVR
jgi:hypothetical protein